MAESSGPPKGHPKLWAVILTVVVLNMIAFGVTTVEGKRAFAIRMRSKSNHNTGGALGRNSRKNYHHMHQEGVGGMVRNPPVPDVQPPRPIGWSVDGGHTNSHPIGPPPAYPGLSHHAVPPGGAPPAYSHSRLHPPSYAEAVGHPHSYAAAAPLVAPRHYDYGHNSALYGDSNAIGSSYGSSYGYHQRGSSPFSMGSILTGAALWHVAHGIGHHHHRQHHHHGASEHGINSEEHYYHHNHQHPHGADGETSTLPPEVENPHIQVNANFDFGPSPNPQEPHDTTTSEPTQPTASTQT
ncbi:disks large-associated protein 3-like [Anopheles cruzii]|uniref:disks large-associated protein 3-like n=1 Tax=Anopheles cruzii TaxID=68878 RepID=UPI0022EC61CD|nr:disks large-associated protein 3-like [Anopheles cruzii]XP_052871021.1 disks large-associated protein 3-like [Anopheles cruzii]